MKHTLLLVCLACTLASCGGGSSDGGEATANSTLNWIAPSARIDGSFLDLSELSGYKIYSGPSSSNLELVAEIDDPQATSYDLSDMEPGDYYFGIISYDINGLRSPISERVFKTIGNK
ncbi:MAG: fibronectin type III domain-containing protein [Candidatus Thiodiazotropha sp.]